MNGPFENLPISITKSGGEMGSTTSSLFHIHSLKVHPFEKHKNKKRLGRYDNFTGLPGSNNHIYARSDQNRNPT